MILSSEMYMCNFITEYLVIPSTILLCFAVITGHTYPVYTYNFACPSLTISTYEARRLTLHDQVYEDPCSR